MLTVALAGNPNCGKTTLFNRLTGSNQTVGNWAGVTVEKKEGQAEWDSGAWRVVDLPGVYSLSPYTMEEVCARDCLLGGEPDVILNLVDGVNIERNLYLTLQLLELELPMVVAVNLMDEVEARGGAVRIDRLARALGVPIVPISARDGQGVDSLPRLLALAAAGRRPRPPLYECRTAAALQELQALAAPVEHPVFFASSLLCGDEWAVSRLGQAERAQAGRIAGRYGGTSGADAMLADARYRLIQDLAAEAVRKGTGPHASLTDRLDRVLTHRVWALPIFLLLLLLMFALVFGPVGSGLKQLMERLLRDGVAAGVSRALVGWGAPAWCESLLVDAVIGGVGGVLTFLPQIALLFLCLSLLEDSGYMARAAFLMDHLLRRLGLTGRSFIPMLMGFGCTTPAVMAARGLGSERDRRLTILMTPFMSCGARMPVYALFAGCFFPQAQGLVVCSLYLLGMAAAVGTGWLLRRTLLRGDPAPFVMELPDYRLPTLRDTLLHLWDKCGGFLVKAGTVIFSMSVLAWLMQNFSFTLDYVEDPSGSMFGTIGAWLAPALRPLGFGSWQAAVALLSGVVAKEAVVSTMGVLYGGTEALPLALAQDFSPLSAYAFMAFTLLYMPCVAAFATIRRELGSWGWAVAAAALQTGLAYLAAWLIYQVGSRLV